MTEPPAALGVPPVPPALPTPDHALADRRQRRGDLGGLEAGGADQLDHGDVAGAVVADHVGLVGLAVADVGHADAGGAVDDVVVGEDLAVGGQHDAGAGRLLVLVADVGVDVDEAPARPWRRSRDVGRVRRRRSWRCPTRRSSNHRRCRSRTGSWLPPPVPELPDDGPWADVAVVAVGHVACPMVAPRSSASTATREAMTATCPLWFFGPWPAGAGCRVVAVGRGRPRRGRQSAADAGTPSTGCRNRCRGPAVPSPGAATAPQGPGAGAGAQGAVGAGCIPAG